MPPGGIGCLWRTWYSDEPATSGSVPSPDYQISSSPNSLTGSPDPRVAVGGWLLVLCLLLLIWQPINVGLTASRALNSITLGGVPVVLVMLLRLVVAGLGVAAGLALLSRRAGAVAFARAVLVASAATDAFVYLTPYFPSSRAPGETPIIVAVSLAYYTAWIVYLSRSRRVRRTFIE
jgi:hypothetical protein